MRACVCDERTFAPKPAHGQVLQMRAGATFKAQEEHVAGGSDEDDSDLDDFIDDL
jgi:hypothetical protein